MDCAPITVPDGAQDGSSYTYDWVPKVLAQTLPGANKGVKGVAPLSGAPAASSSKLDAADGEESKAEPSVPKGYHVTPDRPTRIVNAACGRHHTLLVGSCGRVWACGKNDDGRLGLVSPSHHGDRVYVYLSLPYSGCQDSKNKEVQAFTQVRGPWEKDSARIIQVSLISSWLERWNSDANRFMTGLCRYHVLFVPR